MLQLGIASTLKDHEAVAHLHFCQRIWTLDEGTAKWGRAAVRSLTKAGAERLRGIAVVWGKDADTVLGVLEQSTPPDPTLFVLVAQPVAADHKLHAVIAERRSSGQCFLVEVPQKGAVWHLHVLDPKHGTPRVIKGLPEQPKPKAKKEKPAATPAAPAAPTPAPAPTDAA